MLQVDRGPSPYVNCFWQRGYQTESSIVTIQQCSRLTESSTEMIQISVSTLGILDQEMITRTIWRILEDTNIKQLVNKHELWSDINNDCLTFTSSTLYQGAEPICTVRRNWVSIGISCKNLRELNRCLMDMHCECTLLTALPLLHNSMLHQVAHDHHQERDSEEGEHIQLHTDPPPGLQLVGYNMKERVVAKTIQKDSPRSSCSPVPSTSQTC